MPIFWQIRGYFLLILSTNLLTISLFQISERPEFRFSINKSKIVNLKYFKIFLIILFSY